MGCKKKGGINIGIDYYKELPKLTTGKLLKLHEGCITVESNCEDDVTSEQMDWKNSISIILTETEAEKVIDWYICTQMRSTFIRVYKDRRYQENIDRRVSDVCLYQVQTTDIYLFQITWIPIRLGVELDFVICASCGDPFDRKYKKTDEDVICPWCMSGRT